MNTTLTAVGGFRFIFLPLLFFVVVFALIAKKIGVSYPIVMVAGGLALGFIPGLPVVSLHPDVVFFIILPPLLFAAAATTSWREFQRNITGILLLAFGLVGFLAVAVAAVAPHVFPGFSWQSGLALGAIVATTDAIAATSIVRRTGLSARIADTLEGESLINDATGLLALEFATGIVLDNHIPTVAGTLGTLAWLTVGGIATGLGTAWVVERIDRRIEDGPVEIALTLLTPYFAYGTAEALHGSGVLAVVAAGLLLSRRSSGFLSPVVRLQISAVWESLNFLLNGLVFALIGLQLPAIRAAMQGYSFPALIAQGAVFSALLIVFRLVWVWFCAGGVYLAKKLAGSREKAPAARELFLIGWTGMRGVVSLAAALALPLAFPQRNLILFLTFSVIVTTLLVQGGTLPAVIRALGLGRTSVAGEEEREARRTMLAEALVFLERKQREASPLPQSFPHELLLLYRRRHTSLLTDEQAGEAVGRQANFRSLSLSALGVERAAAIRLRDEDRINDDLLRRLMHELDLGESRLALTEPGEDNRH